MGEAVAVTSVTSVLSGFNGGFRRVRSGEGWFRGGSLRCGQGCRLPAGSPARIDKGRGFGLYLSSSSHPEKFSEGHQGLPGCRQGKPDPAQADVEEREQHPADLEGPGQDGFLGRQAGDLRPGEAAPTVMDEQPQPMPCAQMTKLAVTPCHNPITSMVVIWVMKIMSGAGSFLFLRRDRVRG